MSIVRISHDQSNPYVMLNKKALEDPFLSWAAKGLWAYLMSKPDGWNLSIRHLATVFLKDRRGGGEKAITTLVNELIERGYCTRKQGKSDDGKFGRVEYTVYEFKIIIPQPLERYTAEWLPHEVPPSNKEALANKESEAKEEPPLALAKESEDPLKLLLQQIQTLNLAISEAEIKNWIAKHGIEYTFRTIARCYNERDLMSANSQVRYVQTALEQNFFNEKKDTV